MKPRYSLARCSHEARRDIRVGICPDWAVRHHPFYCDRETVSMTDKALIERLTELAAKATPAPWGVCVDATGDTFVASMTDSAETVCEFGAMDDDEGQSAIAYDSALIVALVNNLPTLTTALTDAEAKLAMAIIPLRALANEEKAYRKAHFEKVQNLARACLAELGEG